jgi:hypothetical protein
VAGSFGFFPLSLPVEDCFLSVIAASKINNLPG